MRRQGLATYVGGGAAPRSERHAPAVPGATAETALTRAGLALPPLRQAHGNRQVQRVVEGARGAPAVRPKLVLGPASDHHERQADHVARQVAEGTAPDRAPAAPGHGHGHRPGGGAIETGLQQAILQARGRGRALPEDVRVPMEQALGTDFSGVRLHTDARADRFNRALRARAFTTGHDVFLRRGETDLSSRSGRELIAHELTHVVQQDGGQPVVQRKLVAIGGDPDHLHDDVSGIKCTPKPGVAGAWIDDVSGDDYSIETNTTTGVQGFVKSAPGFVMPSTPLTFNPPPWTLPALSNPWESPGHSTTFSFSPGGGAYRQGASGGKYSGDNRRHASGYDNPDQFHKNMLPHWETATAPHTPPPPGSSDTQKRKHFKDPNRNFTVGSPGGTTFTQHTGYQDPVSKRSKFVLGHNPSAGSHFNSTGHTQPRSSNLSHNKSTGAYHGLEDSTSSAASGSKEPRYGSPRPDRGSHPTYWDQSAPGFTGGPWSTYAPEPTPGLVGYIENKLNGAAATYSADPEFQRAEYELFKLKQAFSQAAANQLLSLIQKKGW